MRARAFSIDIFAASPCLFSPRERFPFAADRERRIPAADYQRQFRRAPHVPSLCAPLRPYSSTLPGGKCVYLIKLKLDLMLIVSQVKARAVLASDEERRGNSRGNAVAMRRARVKRESIVLY